MDNTIEFSIANKAVNHLGRRLYSSNPPAIAELVANSYDAYATLVDIKFEKSFIVIADNGKGLDLNELQEKYAKIGKSKIEEEPFNNLERRKPMGQKGIGKLAAFSLGDKYTIYTKTLNSDKWISFTLNYQDLLSEANTHSVEYQEIEKENLPNEFDQYQSYSSGMIVKISELRRRVTGNQTSSNLKIHLSRRFYIASNQDNFEVKINDERVDLDKHTYYEDIEILIYFGYNAQEINDLFPNLDVSKKIPYAGRKEITEYFRDKEIKGWLGGVLKPTQIQTQGYDFNNVIVYIHKKIADENIFKESGNARIANQYLVGEVQADCFHSDDSPITSSRQGLDTSDEYIVEFIDNLKEVRKFFISKWDDIRTKNSKDYLPDDIKNNESYKQWIGSLDDKKTKIHNQFLKIMIQGIDKDERDNQDEYSKRIKKIIPSIVHTIDNIEIQELENELNTLRNTENYTKILSSLMMKIASSEQLKIYELIKERIVIIEELKKLMEQKNTLEKFFEQHLYEHPWLINPYWNKDYNNSASFQITRQKYLKGITNKKKIFIDILIKTAEEKYPIIIELKKNTPTGHAKVEYTDILGQIKNYRQILIQNLPNNKEIRPKDIQAFYILSEDTGPSGSNCAIIIDNDNDEYDTIKNNNITLLKYNEIVENCEKLYNDFINIITKKRNIPKFD